MRMAWAGVMISTVIGCTPIAEMTDQFVGDLKPPIFIGAQATGEYTVVVQFDEPATLLPDTIAVEPVRTVVSCETNGNDVTLEFDRPLEAGTQYWIDAVAEDERGNTTSFLVQFFGVNERLPQVIVNEFSCEGSSKHPDIVELLVLEDGNLGGMTLYDGSPSVYDDIKMLPPIDVAAGDFVLVHFKPQNVAEEVDELDDRTASGGLNAHPEAWDVWVDGGDGIPNTTGALTLCAYPGGPVLDGVLFSTKTYDPSDDLRGYGRAAQLQQAEEMVLIGAWSASGDVVIPQDAVNPLDSTATRTICRSDPWSDTNTRADWHIVPTGKSSFGEANCNDRY